jgi:hypothetical protein
LIGLGHIRLLRWCPWIKVVEEGNVRQPLRSALRHANIANSAEIAAMFHEFRKTGARAFSSEVDTGSREENASKQEARASVLIQSEPIML